MAFSWEAVACYLCGVKVLGIDPGTRLVGYAILDMPEERGSEPSPSPIRNLVRPRFKSGCSRLGPLGVWKLGPRSGSIPMRLRELARLLREQVRAVQPDVLAVESAFYGKSVSSALRLGEARGVILLVAAELELEIAEYPPALIKRRVTGNGSASKESVARILQQEFGEAVAALPLDASDALAIAWCHVQEQRSAGWKNLLGGG
ncbi:MAG: hypothetical protein CSA62_13710 [Planctomycetota bacterium]|nr:MAG: hypothetical protein CSA62_13710 [Planctomycetota bacterium]